MACDGISREAEAKAAWLAKQAVPAAFAAPALSEAAARAAWLAKQDLPSAPARAAPVAPAVPAAPAAAAAPMQQLGFPAAVTSAVVEAKTAVLEAACDQGVEVACGALSREEEAKAAWLAKQDVPAAPVTSEAVARAAWLAKQDVPVVAAAPPPGLPNVVGAVLEVACEKGVEVACGALTREEEVPSAQRPTPNAQCPMPNAQCPMPNAHCPMPIANYSHDCPLPIAHYWP